MELLLIIDMQNDFITGSLPSENGSKIIPYIIDLCNKFPKENIYFTQDTHNKDYLQTNEGKNLPIEHGIKDTHGWQIINELQPYILPNHIIEKDQFAAIDLINIIEKLNPTTINIVGVCSDICVLNNALLLKTYFPNIIFNIYENGCAGTTIENHQKAIDLLKINHINIK